jgi:hypothetical protein
MAITVVFQWIGSDVKIKSRGNISGTICLFHQRSEGVSCSFFQEPNPERWVDVANKTRMQPTAL